jgi:two-component sensor histidine kinase
VRTRLLNELDHRVRNMLATILAIAHQTRKRSTSLDEFGAAFEGRLHAMARSHGALVEGQWSGADLQTVILECCKPFCEDSRLKVHGPPIKLWPKAVVGMSMVTHELATNSAKYGALRTPDGVVLVEWEERAIGSIPMLSIRWREENCPVQERSKRTGFGSILIRSIIEGDLRGSIKTKLEAGGLHWTAMFPLRARDGGVCSDDTHVGAQQP